MRHRRGNFRIGLIALCALWPGRGVLQENINFFMLSLSIEIFILRIFIISHYVYKEPLMKNVLFFCFMFFVWKIEPVLSKNITFFRQKLCQKTNVSCPFSWKKQKTFRCKSPLRKSLRGKSKTFWNVFKVCESISLKKYKNNVMNKI